MPNVPGWFQAPDYFFNKLAQMKVSNAEYTAEDLVKAFNDAGYTIAGAAEADIAAADEQLLRHFNDWGNAENVSPNNYFNVAAYKANKLAQVIADGQAVPEGFTEWNEAALNAAMEAAGLSYWDHYTQYGTAEGINPSSAFNTDEYLQKKADQLNNLPEGQQQPLPDGTLGEWTPALVAEAFRDADLNAVEHYMLYNASENIGYVPGPEQPANTVQLTPGAEVVDDGGISTAFTGIVTNNPGTNTLDREDQITGTNNDDQLDATLNAQWIGFMNKGGMKGVPTVNITAKGDYDFNAKGIEGATTYNVNGNSDLAELGADVTTVNLNNVDQGNYSIGFANRVMNGKTDALTLGVNNVVTYDDDMKAQDVKVQVYGVENLTVNATGDTTSRIQLVDSNLEALNITGDGDLRVASTSTRIASVDGSAATGDIRVNTGSSKVADVKLGSGDDTLITTGIAKNATVDGGEGQDTIQFDAGAAGTYALSTEALETVKFHNSGNITINGQNMNGLEGFALDAQHNSVTLNNVGPDLDLAVSDLNTSHVTAQTVENLNVTVGDGDPTDPEANPRNDVFNGSITGKSLTSMSINMAEEDSQFVLDGTGNLQNLSQVNIAGVGNVEPDAGFSKGMVDLSAATSLGSKAANLSVQAGSYEGNFKAAFSSNAKTDTLYVTGSEGNNNIKISGSGYDYLEVVGDGNTNVIDLRGYNGDTKDAFINLSGDANVILVDDPAKWGDRFKDIQGQVITSTSDIRQDFLAQGMIVDIEGTSGTTIPVNLGNMTTTDFSGVKYADGTKVNYTGLQDGQELIIGQTTGLTGTGNTAVANTTLNATNTTDIVLQLSGEDSQVGLLTNSLGATTVATEANATLSLSNTSGGDVSIMPDRTGLADDKASNYSLSNLQSISVDTGSVADATTTLFGYALPNGQGFASAKVILAGLENIEVSGSGDANFLAQFGAISNKVFTFDASSATGDITAPLITSKVIDYTGSAGNDTVTIYATGTDTSTIDLGSGNDSIAFNLNGAAQSKTAFTTIDLTLGSGEDSIVLSTGSLTSSSEIGGTFIKISDFAAGEDSITNISNLKLTSIADTAAAQAMLANFDINNATSATVSGNVIAYNGNSYVAFSTTSVSSPAEGQLTGMCLVELTGVESITTSSIGTLTPAS